MPGNTRTKKLLVSIACLLLLAGAVGAALLWWRGFAQREGGRAAPFLTGLTSPEREWQRQTVGELSVETPFRFGKGPDVSGQLPEEIRALIERWETHEAASPAGEVRVQLSHVAYRPEVAFDLDGAAEGAMTQATAALGDATPGYTVEPAEVSGLDARRSAYQGTAAGRPLFLDALFVQREQQFWQVQGLSTSERSRRVVSRLLESVRILPPADGTGESAAADRSTGK